MSTDGASTQRKTVDAINNTHLECGGGGVMQLCCNGRLKFMNYIQRGSSFRTYCVEGAGFNNSTVGSISHSTLQQVMGLLNSNHSKDVNEYKIFQSINLLQLLQN